MCYELRSMTRKAAPERAPAAMSGALGGSAHAQQLAKIERDRAALQVMVETAQAIIDRVLELLQRGDRARVEIKPVEEHGLILRKKARVIFEHNKIVLSDLCVG